MTVVLWIGFVAVVLGLLALDLGMTRRRHRVLAAGDALAWTIFYVFLALLFNVAVYSIYEASWLGAGLGPGGDCGSLLNRARDLHRRAQSH